MTDRPVFVLGSFVVACTATVPRVPRPGEALAAEIVTIEPGGKGLNLAIMARRLGMTVDGLLAIGDDLAAAFAAPALQRADLPQAMLVEIAGPTGSGVGFIDPRGETSVAIASGVNFAITRAHIRERAGAIAGAALALAQFETSDEAVAETFDIARRAGVPTLLNPSPFRPVTPEILQRTSILIVNETEAGDLAAAIGHDPAITVDPAHFAGTLAPAIMALGPDLVVMTRGAAGAVAAPRDGAALSQAGIAVATVDALGAGDAFAATLGVSLARKHGLAEALRLAAAAGALTTTRHGVFDALPTGEAIRALLGKS
ncbi:ribokinase [Bosea sp. OAE752]|uniref:PfkB family carbohydrate kinase n=1 Tax=unclassified Bosea (in: a-proteobacteria) TaxID=2653178 RepID=UPI00352391BE